MQVVDWGLFFGTVGWAPRQYCRGDHAHQRNLLKIMADSVAVLTDEKERTEDGEGFRNRGEMDRLATPQRTRYVQDWNDAVTLLLTHH